MGNWTAASYDQAWERGQGYSDATYAIRTARSARDGLKKTLADCKKVAAGKLRPRGDWTSQVRSYLELNSAQILAALGSPADYQYGRRTVEEIVALTPRLGLNSGFRSELRRIRRENTWLREPYAETDGVPCGWLDRQRMSTGDYARSVGISW